MELCTDVLILHQPAAYITHNAPLPVTAVCQQQLLVLLTAAEVYQESEGWI